MSYDLLKKILFRLDPELAHYLTLEGLRLTHQIGLIKKISLPALPRTVMNLPFPNPVGLAAGMDKNGDYIEALAALGFGFIEIGTVTPKPQAGNPKPRLFRLIKQQALINRLGFNNKGVDYVVERLKQTQFKGVIGVNIGKNFTTKLENAHEDYLSGFRKVAPYASYVTVNISSPNTPELRDLQHGDLLSALLKELKQAQAQQKKYVPLVIKISPDLSPEELTSMATILLAAKVDGVIATNTTLSRSGIEGAPFANESGGLSGKPLFQRSHAIIKQLSQLLQNQIPIIACGGISNAEEMRSNLLAGASLIQIYTSFIYNGPRILSKLFFD